MPAKKQVPKEAILIASLSLLRNGGIEALTIKEVAKKLGCSTQPVYLSFEGMEELRLETTKEAQRFFINYLKASKENPANLYGLRYIRFAKEESNLFKFLFMRQNAFSELREALAPIMDGSISQIMEQYHIEQEEAHHFHDQLWVHTHGIASMIATGFCDWNMDKVQKMLSECEQYLSRKYGEQNV